VQAAALKDALVGGPVQFEALREALLVAVERVRVLHDELADAQQTAAGTGLVAVLDREVVEDLRQLPVALKLARMERHGLLVRDRQHVLAAGAVFEAKELRDVVAPGLFPELERRQDRHQHLLAADRIDLLAHDLRDFLMHAPAERQKRPDARRNLPDVAAAHKQLVADRIGVRRRVTQRGHEEV